jgi:hypothetical protein
MSHSPTPDLTIRPIELMEGIPRENLTLSFLAPAEMPEDFRCLKPIRTASDAESSRQDRAGPFRSMTIPNPDAMNAIAISINSAGDPARIFYPSGPLARAFWSD